MRVRVKDTMNKAVRGSPEKIITWMTDDLGASLQNKRETDEEFKKRSDRNTKNKAKGPKGKIGHSQGSRSATMWAERLMKQLGRRPSAAEWFATTHSKVDENGQWIWYDAHARSVYDKYEQLKVGIDVQLVQQQMITCSSRPVVAGVRRALYTDLEERVLHV